MRKLYHGLVLNTSLWIIFANMIHKIVFKSNPWNNFRTDVPKMAKTTCTGPVCGPCIGPLWGVSHKFY